VGTLLRLILGRTITKSRLEISSQSNFEEDFVSYQLQSQLNVWWQTVSSEETFGTYQKTIQTTWQILQETTKLLWLFLCLGLVLFTWIGETTQQSGRQLKTWVNSIPEPKAEHIWSEVSARLSALSRSSATSMVAQAREQLGLSTAAPKKAAALSSPPPTVTSVAAAPDAVKANAPTAITETASADASEE
jgi:hypothetical protein